MVINSLMYQTLSVAKSQNALIKNSLESQLVDIMTHLNIGMISFVQNGDTSNFDVPKIYVTYDQENTDSYVTKEVVAVVLRSNSIYVIPDVDFISAELYDELDQHTHFTIRDRVKMSAGIDEVVIKVNSNYNLLNANDTMLQIFKSCYEALIDIDKPLTQTINITD